MGISSIRSKYTPAGANREIQINDNGVLGSSSGFVLNSSGYVGIGVNNPLRGLHLEGDSGISAIRFKTTGGEWDFAPFWSAFDDGNFSLNRVSGSGNLLIPSGNVGIGETNPSQLLHLSGAPATGGIRIDEESNTAYQAYLTFLDTSGNFGLDVNGGGRLRFATGGSENLTILSSGNVGINQSVPAAKLHIEGDNYSISNGGRATDGLIFLGGTVGTDSYTNGLSFGYGLGSAAIAGVQTGGDSDVVGLAFFTHPSGTGTDDAQESMRIKANGNVGINETNPLTQLHVSSSSGISKIRLEDDAGRKVEIQSPDGVSANGRIGTITNHNFEINAGNGHGSNFISFLTDSDEKMRITNAGEVELTHNIGTVGAETGIGIYNKNTVQHGSTYSNAYKSTIKFYFDNASGNDEKLLSAMIASRKLNSWSTAAATNKDANLEFYTLDNDNFGKRMVITPNGSVWIGNDASTMPNFVESTDQLAGDQFGRLVVGWANGHTSGNTSGADMGINIWNSITSNVAEKGSFIGFSDNYFSDPNWHNVTRASIKGGTEVAGNNASGFLAFFTSGATANTLSEKMRITSAGDVSIGGNTTPLARLHVADEYNSDSDIAYFENTHSDGGAFLTIKQYETTAQPVRAAAIRLGTKGSIIWYQGILRRGGSDHFNTWSLNTTNDNNTSEAKFAVTTGGNVGIGETRPPSLLTLKGGNILLEHNSTDVDGGHGIFFHTTTNSWSEAAAHAAIYGKRVDASNGYLRFDTRSGGTTTERARITSAGVMQVGGQTGTLKLGNDALYYGTIEWEYANNELAHTINNVGVHTFNTNGKEVARFTQSTSNSGGLILKSNAGNDLIVMGAEGSGGNEENGFIGGYQNGTQKFSIGATTGPTWFNINQNFGIGTDSPLQKLDVRGYTSLLMGHNWGVTWTSTPASALYVGNGDNSTFHNGVALIHAENKGNRGNIANSIGSDLLRLEYNDRDGILYNKYGAFQIGNFTARSVTTGDDVMMMQLEGIPRNDGTNWQEWPGIQIIANNANTGGGALYLAHARGSTIGSNTALSGGDNLGLIGFSGANGTDIQTGATIYATNNNPWSSFNQGTDIVFQTTANGSTAYPSDRMRINSYGTVVTKVDNGYDNIHFIESTNADYRAGIRIESNGFLAFYQAFNGGPNYGSALNIDNFRRVLIGYTSSNGSYNLQVNSQIFATNSTIATSDGRYKEDVQTLSNATDLVSRLNPVQFKWKSHEIHNLDVGKTDVGFIAQEVQAVLSDTDYSDSVVVTNKTDDEEYLGLGETKLIPLLTAALQEAITKIETLETKVAALEAV